MKISKGEFHYLMLCNLIGTIIGIVIIAIPNNPIWYLGILLIVFNMPPLAVNLIVLIITKGNEIG